VLGGCSLKMPRISLWEDESSKLSPRVVEYGQPVPKGGGRHKVGSPYRIKGRRYVPREVDRYDETGVASWYGMLFHGRRTANGEVYDMEALTAAHPTLPIPSYVRVSSLKNGRSLVVRVNDRGPYANDRIIDLSWAVASLLHIERAGTGPVRVEYLGPAPLSGNDRHERDILARQPWAGPRVAYAPSPAKAMRARYAAASPAPTPTARAQKTVEKPVAVASLSARPPQKLGMPTALVPPPKIGKAPLRERFKAAEKPATPPVRQVRIEEHHLPASATAPAPASAPVQPRALEPTRPAEPSAVASLAASPARAASLSPYYVEAGLFPQKSIAERLAAILKEIAPATVELVKIGERPLHRIRLGPFTARDEARAAAQRIRAAGLSGARVEGKGDS
jgi:rare lipoprotein A